MTLEMMVAGADRLAKHLYNASACLEFVPSRTDSSDPGWWGIVRAGKEDLESFGPEVDADAAAERMLAALERMSADLDAMAVGSTSLAAE